MYKNNEYESGKVKCQHMSSHRTIGKIDIGKRFL